MAFIRICADSASLAAIFGAMMVITSYYHPTLTKSAICYDLFWNGISDLIIQLCDNLSFLNRFQAAHKVPKWKNYTIYAYISLVMVLTRGSLLTQFICCLWTPTQLHSWKLRSSYSELMGGVQYAYNFNFTIEFTVVIYQVSFQGPA